MVRLVLALLLGLAITPLAAAPAEAQQGGAWTLGSGHAERTVPEARSRGYPAIPLSSLVALGVEIGSGRGEVSARLGGRELRFIPDSPFFRAGDTVYQLVHPVYQEDGVMYLPVQFLVDQLPILAGPSLVVEQAERRIFRADDTRRADAADPAPDPTPAAALPGEGMKRLIVIDPGHGGRDPGALGPGGTREKDVALTIGRKVAELLRGDDRYDVRMTRDRDTLIALADRRRMANRWREEGQPALFMSVHANASSNRSARGFETYFLAEARTEQARQVAARENAAQRFEQEENGSPGGDDPLAFILHDLLFNHYLHESSTWAGLIQDRIAQVHPGPNRGVKQAGFAVLNGTFMPAVLVEVGFITHPAEERLLRDAAYQQRIAERLRDSVHDYFRLVAGEPAEEAEHAR